MPEALMSPQDVADYYSVPLRTVYAWRHRGCGPRAFKIGRHVRYRREDVESFLAEHADPAPAA